MPQKRFADPQGLTERYPGIFSKPTLQRWRSEGIGPPFSLLGPRRVVYDLDQVEEWLSKRTVQSTAAARALNASEQT